MLSAPLAHAGARDPEKLDDGARLGPWFHNLHLPDGAETAPAHPLGDFPARKWRQIAPHLPEDLTGWSVLDAGCNAGYYSFELARRGARVLGIDSDPHFLRQAKWARARFDLDSRVRFRRAHVYDVARTPMRFDLVLFLGVFYHLRYPQLALDALAAATRRMLVFQTLTMPGTGCATVDDDYPIEQREQFHQRDWPRVAFVENRFAGDATNWWVPNHAACMALLRSAGLRVARRPGHEIYICERSGGAPPHVAELRAAAGADRSRSFSSSGAPCARRSR